MHSLQVEGHAEILPEEMVHAPVERRSHLMRRPVALRHQSLKAVLVNVRNLRKDVVNDSVAQGGPRHEKGGLQRRKQKPRHDKEHAPEQDANGEVEGHAPGRRGSSDGDSVVVVAVEPHGSVLAHRGLQARKGHGDEQRLEPSAVHGKVGSPRRHAVSVPVLRRLALKRTQIRILVQHVGVGVMSHNYPKYKHQNQNTQKQKTNPRSPC